MTALTDSNGRPRVVVTGMGVKTPAGVDVDTMWATVRAGRGTAAVIERFDPTELPVWCAGAVRHLVPRPFLGPKGAPPPPPFPHPGLGPPPRGPERRGGAGRGP